MDVDVWHRVRIGPISNLDELDKLRRQLQAADVDALVMRWETDLRLSHRPIRAGGRTLPSADALVVPSDRLGFHVLADRRLIALRRTKVPCPSIILDT
jgi:hypothetical protein